MGQDRQTCWPSLHNKLFLDRVVLTNICLDLLDNWPVLNLNSHRMSLLVNNKTLESQTF